MTNQAKQALDLYLSSNVLPSEKDCAIDQNWNAETTCYRFSDNSVLVLRADYAPVAFEAEVQS